MNMERIWRDAVMVINEWMWVDSFIRDVHAVLGRVHVCAMYLKCFHLFPQSTLVFRTKLDSPRSHLLAFVCSPKRFWGCVFFFFLNNKPHFWVTWKRHLSELLRGRGRRGKMLKTDNHTARFSCASWPLTRHFFFVLSPLNDPIR